MNIDPDYEKSHALNNTDVHLVSIPQQRYHSEILQRDEYPLEVIKSRRRKRTISIQVTATGIVRISVPHRYSQKRIKATLDKHRPWIHKTLAKRLHKEPAITEGSTVNFLGRKYILKKNSSMLKVTCSSENLMYPNDADLKNDLKVYYKTKAQGFIPGIVKAEANRIGLEYCSISLKNQKTRWGSCSSKKNLNFNYLLIQCPLEVIKYVIIHELCHLKHMNHSEEFWEMVCKYDPCYKEHIKELKKYATQLHITAL